MRRKEIIKKRKIEAIAIKYKKTRREIILFKKEKRNLKNNIKDKIDLDQVNNKYLL